jgi:hypothetical protein
MNLRSWPLMAVVVAVALGGCEKKGRPVVEVTGTVTHGGKPLPHVIVYFTPDVGRPSYGGSDEQGRYFQLGYTRDRTGVVTGKHTVHVVNFQPIKSLEDEKKIKEGKIPVPAEWASVPDKYKKNETSPLKVDVEKDGQVIDLKLD